MEKQNLIDVLDKRIEAVEKQLTALREEYSLISKLKE